VLQDCTKYQRKIILGVNVLPNEFNLSIPWASEYGARFVQLDYVAGKYLGNKELDIESYLDVCERYPDVAVLGGVWPKHYTPIGSDLRKDLLDGAARADAVVVTGTGTGQETPARKIKAFRKILDEYAEGYPVVVGAGVTADNAREQLELSDGAIIGTYFRAGDVRRNIAKENVERIMSIMRQIRKQ
jgi:predicted TIM-barrel enzyme